MRTSRQVRQEFLKFFEERGHAIVPSAPLVPDDPTLLFTNAGMVQFKDVFLGTGRRPYSRAVDTQKCLRVSGKHNDLDEVGVDTTHHTFFEMLGNWSFGDYFKKEAICWAWELLVDRWGLEPDRLYATVHEGDARLGLEADREAADCWKSETDIPPEHVLSFGSKDNFWMMGDVGPCGPCSEVHVDLRPDSQRQTPGVELVNKDHPQVIEVWNLVFIQYDAREDGTLVPLPQKHVDTGLGLERMVAILQGKASNYETDLFAPIVERVRALRGHSKEEMEANITPYRVLADHGRAMAFLMAEGVVPGNERQKYVLRMVMRRAIRFGKKLGIEKPFMAEVGQAVIDTLGDVFPELRESRMTILKWAKQEEKLFDKTLNRGLKRFETYANQLQREGQTVFPGKFAFYLHDTLGFPVEVTEDLARERGLSVDRQGFKRKMKEQKERSRVHIEVKDVAKGTDHATVEIVGPATAFKGYKQLECQSELISKLLATNGEVFTFDKTPFYPTGGGQVSDVGCVKNLSRPGRAEVTKVKRVQGGVIYHHLHAVEGEFHGGDRCLLQVDVPKRKATQRNHTATHLLHAALHRVVGKHAKQAGSLVAPDELRFDFTHFEALTPEQIEQIEEVVNRVILDDLQVEVTEESLEGAKAQGAMALFAEDYRDREKVRMVSVLEPDGAAFSRELCGGTHVASTGEIGLFKVIAEEGVSAGVRRVRVATGKNLLNYLRRREELLERAAALLETSPAELVPRLAALLAEHRALKGRIEGLQRAQVATQVERFLAQKETFNGLEAIVAQADLGGDALKELADLLENELEAGVVLLGSAGNDRVQLVCKVSRALTSRVQAGQLIKALSPIVGGGGGGAPGFAQGGGGRPDKLPEALEKGKALLRQLVS